MTQLSHGLSQMMISFLKMRQDFSILLFSIKIFQILFLFVKFGFSLLSLLIALVRWVCRLLRMENVDKIIFESFTKLKCSFCGSDTGTIPDLSLLSADNVVEGVVRFLWRCDSSMLNAIPSYAMPGHTTARFRMAMKLSDSLKKIGIKEEFGYQTFLYHNVFDVRRLFLALIDKLPEESMLLEVKLTPIEQLKLDIGKAIEVHLTSPWVPEFCRYLRMKYDGRFWHPREGQSEDYPFCTCRSSTKKFDHRQNICAIIASNEAIDATDAVSEYTNLFSKINSRPQKPVVPPKPSKLKLQSSVAKPETLSDSSPIDESIQLLSTSPTENDEILKEIVLKQSSIDEKRKNLIELRYAQARLEEHFESMKLQHKENDKRLLQLLENPEESVEKLQKIINETSQRRIELQENFVELQNAKMAELNELKHRQGLAEVPIENSMKMEIIKQRIDEVESLIIERNRMKSKLERALKKVSSTHSTSNDRSKYVTRVLEIVASVNKQNEEILKTVKSIKKLEHELKSLSGNLDRTFTVVDGWLGSRSELDPKMQRAYRFLVRTHEHCSLIKTAINERGQITRNIDELTNQIENQNSMDSQLERILNDLMLIREENHKLAQKIES